MESAPELSASRVGEAGSYSVERRETSGRRPDAVVLQVDATVSAIDGLAWLAARRNDATAERLAALQQEAATQRWGWADLTRARLKHLRPRRAEINQLGAAYLSALVPGAADAAKALRRAGIAVALASDVAAEALFGVATALGVSPNELYAPRLRFDAIGAYVGCDLNTARVDDANDATGSARRCSPRVSATTSSPSPAWWRARVAPTPSRPWRRSRSSSRWRCGSRVRSRGCRAAVVAARTRG
jgi:hypothetical protein